MVWSVGLQLYRDLSQKELYYPSCAHGDLVHGPAFWFVTEGTYTIANLSFTCYFSPWPLQVWRWAVWTGCCTGEQSLHHPLLWGTTKEDGKVCTWANMFAEYPAPFSTHLPHPSTPLLLLPNGEEWPQRTGLIPRTPSLGMSVTVCAYMSLEERLDHTHLFALDSKWHHPAWYHLAPL